MRKIQFSTGEYYHVYNRGVDKREIFFGERDFVRFLRGMREFNNKSGHEQRDYVKRMERKKLSFEYSKLSFNLSNLPKLVDIVCYCLNSNHYHFILKQLVEDGISRFMHKLDLGYTKYFNQRHDRSGSLLQGTFKAAHLNDDDKIVWMSGYVNGNSEIHKIAKAENYPWCSYLDYVGKRRGTLCNKEVILRQFEDVNKYRVYVADVAGEYHKRREMKDLMLD